jgi:hypothetical protein
MSTNMSTNNTAFIATIGTTKSSTHGATNFGPFVFAFHSTDYPTYLSTIPETFMSAFW